MTTITIHPAVDSGIAATKANFSGGKLYCHCSKDPVEITVKSQSAHNHVCGCTRCWKPAGALFSMVAVAPRSGVKATANSKKLGIVDKKALIQRHACKKCGVHMFGRINDKKHAFFGLDFIHTELSPDSGWSAPQFAAFVSSIIESGFPPAETPRVRTRLREIGLEPYDCLSPALMDVLAAHAAKRAGKKTARKAKSKAKKAAGTKRAAKSAAKKKPQKKKK